MLPNPGSGWLQIKSKANTAVSYAVFNAIGKLCASGRSDTATFGLDLGSLAKGVYQLRLAGKESVWVEKMVRE